jgi:hypothetical protein
MPPASAQEFLECTIMVSLSGQNHVAGAADIHYACAGQVTATRGSYFAL